MLHRNLLRNLWGLALLSCATAVGAQVHGSVSLTASGKPLRAEAAADVVVYFRADQPQPVAPLPQAGEMRTERKQFQPRALPVTVGSAVRFPNMDPILHNVFSTGPRVRFDLGVYGGGEERTFTFDSPGLVRVYCNVHHDMVGHVLVLDTRWFTRPGADGSFQLDVPAGVRGELFAWHERAPLWRRKLEAGEQGLAEVRLDMNRPRIPRHMNKFGKPYGSDRARGY